MTQRVTVDLDEILYEERYDCPGLGLVVEPAEVTGFVAIKYVRVPMEARGSGTARRIMQRVVEWADRCQVALAVTPTGEYGSRREHIVRALRSFGFVDDPSLASGYSMVRQPACPAWRSVR